MGSLRHYFIKRRPILDAGLIIFVLFFSVLGPASAPAFGAAAPVSPDTLAHLKTLETVLGKTSSQTSRDKLKAEIDRIRREYNLDENNQPRATVQSAPRGTPPKSSSQSSTQSSTTNSGSSTYTNGSQQRANTPPRSPDEDPTNPLYWDRYLYNAYRRASARHGMQRWQVYSDAILNTRKLRKELFENLDQQILRSRIRKDGHFDELVRNKQTIQQVYDLQESKFKADKLLELMLSNPTASETISIAKFDSNPRLTYINGIKYGPKRADGVALIAALLAQPWDKESMYFLGSAMEQFTSRFKTSDLRKVLNEIINSKNESQTKLVLEDKNLEFINGAVTFLKASLSAESIRILNLARRNNPFNKSPNLRDRDEYQRTIDLAVDEMVRTNPSLGKHVVREESSSPIQCFFSRVRASVAGN
jgi:hypothetical protein